jgi:hypothetical protein
MQTTKEHGWSRSATPEVFAFGDLDGQADGSHYPGSYNSGLNSYQRSKAESGPPPKLDGVELDAASGMRDTPNEVAPRGNMHNPTCYVVLSVSKHPDGRIHDP